MPVNEFEEDPEAAEVPSDASLGRLAALGRAVVAQRRAVAEAEDALKRAKAALAGLEERDIPAMLIELQIPGFDLEGGGSIRLAKDYYASVPKKDKDRRAKLFAWLREIAAGSIIKRKVVIQFPKADTNEAARLVEWAKKELTNVKIVEEEDVHHSTLKAFAKQLLVQGLITEGDEHCVLLGAYVRRYADVELPGEERKPKPAQEDEEE